MNKRKLAAIMWCLEREPGMRGPELCNITGIWRSSIYVYLADLERRGLVYRKVTQKSVLLPGAVGLGTYDVIRYYNKERIDLSTGKPTDFYTKGKTTFDGS